MSYDATTLSTYLLTLTTYDETTLVPTHGDTVICWLGEATPLHYRSYAWRQRPCWLMTRQHLLLRTAPLSVADSGEATLLHYRSDAWRQRPCWRMMRPYLFLRTAPLSFADSEARRHRSKRELTLTGSEVQVLKRGSGDDGCSILSLSGTKEEVWRFVL